MAKNEGGLISEAEALRRLGLNIKNARRFRVMDRDDFPDMVWVGTDINGVSKYLYRASDIQKFLDGMTPESEIEKGMQAVRQLFNE